MVVFIFWDTRSSLFRNLYGSNGSVYILRCNPMMMQHLWRQTCEHLCSPRLVRSVLLIFLSFYVVLCFACLRPVSCVFNVAKIIMLNKLLLSWLTTYIYYPHVLFLFTIALPVDLWLLISPLASSNFSSRVISKDMLLVNISGQLRLELSWQQWFKEIINRIWGWGYGV